jgi:hypothetical protein
MIRLLVCLVLLISITPRVYSQQQLYIRLNQLGFTTRAPKTAVVFGSEPLPAEFRVLNAESGAQLFKGLVEPLGGGWGGFERHGLLRFTALAIEGRYILNG